MHFVRREKEISPKFILSYHTSKIWGKIFGYTTQILPDTPSLKPRICQFMRYFFVKH